MLSLTEAAKNSTCIPLSILTYCFFLYFFSPIWSPSQSFCFHKDLDFWKRNWEDQQAFSFPFCHLSPKEWARETKNCWHGGKEKEIPRRKNGQNSKNNILCEATYSALNIHLLSSSINKSSAVYLLLKVVMLLSSFQSEGNRGLLGWLLGWLPGWHKKAASGTASLVVLRPLGHPIPLNVRWP